MKECANNKLNQKIKNNFIIFFSPKKLIREKFQSNLKNVPKYVKQ